MYLLPAYFFYITPIPMPFVWFTYYLFWSAHSRV